MKKIFLLLLMAVLLITAFVLFRTFTFTMEPVAYEPVEKTEVPPSAGNHLAEAISIPTVSFGDREPDSAAFFGFQRFVKHTYPLTDSLLDQTNINTYSLVFERKGSDPNLKPVILMGHYDVVPVVEEDLDKWSHPPFANTIEDGIIWGRGAIDDKVTVIGLLEAVELLLQQNFIPKRTIYLCFGHDEEIGGMNGAVKIVEYLKSKEVDAAFVLDEGFAITEGIVPGVKEKVALIGTAEKGFITLNLSVDVTGGHSSMPASESAVDIMARAVVKLKDNPFPTRITKPVEEFLSELGPAMPFSTRMAIANQWLFGPVIMDQLSETPSGNALMRTTTAPTIFQSGVKDNVIPYSAKATVNFRTLPGTSNADVISHVRETIGDDRIKITEGPFNSESPLASSSEGFGYTVIQRTVHEVFPNILSAPNLVVGATDSRYYYPLSDNVYRFTPMQLNPEIMTTFHGVDEHISVSDFENAIRYYVQLIHNTDNE
ncbi:MAG: M20 family peptidase [Cyclobacteriaceae bacterium]